MRHKVLLISLLFTSTQLLAAPLGLPEVPIPANNPQTEAKISLGDKLFHDMRFSRTGDISCATCHDAKKGFTDSPLAVSQGIGNLEGTRNAPTVINSAYMTTLFWDGREPDLEGQSAGPFVNPVEMGLQDHQPILDIVRTDPDYIAAFEAVFGKPAQDISMTEVKMAIASFERTIIAGDSPFDRYYFGDDPDALNASEIRGFQVFLEQGRCVSCHTINQEHALFTDNRFHNIGIGFASITHDVTAIVQAHQQARKAGEDLDVAVLTKGNVSELGRYVVTDKVTELGAFKTATLRNVAVTGPYMHDGSLETLEDVVDFYNNGGVVDKSAPVSPFTSGGIRPLDLDAQQKIDLVNFLKALTSPEFAQSAKR